MLRAPRGITPKTVHKYEITSSLSEKRRSVIHDASHRRSSSRQKRRVAISFLRPRPEDARHRRRRRRREIRSCSSKPLGPRMLLLFFAINSPTLRRNDSALFVFFLKCTNIFYDNCTSVQQLPCLLPLSLKWRTC